MTYAVKDVFDTLQGEGARAGARSVFVRLAGCNLWDGLPAHRSIGKGACSEWCDTDFVGGEKLEAPQIVTKMNGLWPGGSYDRWCVISGGEPTLQLDDELIAALHGDFWHIAVETNGTLNPVGKSGRPVLDLVDWVTMSPKLGSKIVRRQATEVKVILPGQASLGWRDDDLEQIVNLVAASHYFVQPQDPIVAEAVEASYLKSSGKLQHLASQYRGNVQLCIDFVRTHPRWRLSMQTHKFIGLP